MSWNITGQMQIMKTRNNDKLFIQIWDLIIIPMYILYYKLYYDT